MKRLLVSLLPFVFTHCVDAGGKSSVAPDATIESADSAESADSKPSETSEVTTPDAPDPTSDATVTESAAGLTLVANEGTTVAPQTVVHLHLELDEGVAAPASVQWSVSQPSGSQSIFGSSTSPLAATFEANVVGGYRFAALALDAEDRTIATMSLLVMVVPAYGLHIELSWRTPGDVDETDSGGDQIYFSVGSDVDLHVLHPKAYGAYFDYSYDCYWENTNPEWGVFGPADNPRLDRDDTDGAGPEITALSEPEPDSSYTVGVHYWSNWGYGKAFATVRIYFDGVLQDEWADVELEDDELWESHTIQNGVVTRVGSAPKIIPNFRGSGFFPGDSGSLALTSAQGTAVVPNTELDLLAEWRSPNALLDRLEWSVVKPQGSLAVLVPGTSQFEAKFTPDVVGAYTIELYGLDAAGTRIATTTLLVMVSETTHLRVELAWRTPNDQDETDVGGSKSFALGSDLDLHLRHPNAAEYFDPSYDCSWRNLTPEWGIFSPVDNPTLIRDDVDGGGPEIITLPAPEPGQTYRVGVHFWSDSGYGNAFATVRVYVDDVLQDEWTDVELTPDDLWEAFTIVDGVVSRVGSAPIITPLYSETHLGVRP